ncbi:MAG TPA: hypothetical protein VD995_05560 [Azospirillum sp.]|nr:hypothetical protein [Azospirillum sp.]
MTGRKRQAYDSFCRDLLQHASDRLERLRSSVERRGEEERLDLERALDELRGRRNRLMARVEAARQASDDAWPFARAQADQAVGDLVGGLDELENRLQRAAA